MSDYKTYLLFGRFFYIPLKYLDFAPVNIQNAFELYSYLHCRLQMIVQRSA